MHFVLPGFRLVTSYLLDRIMRDSSEVAFNLQAELKSAQSELSALREENERLKSESFEELYNAAIDERDALREELAEYQKILLSYKNNYVTKLSYNAVQSSLTAAEQRNADLIDLIQKAHTWVDRNNFGGWDAYELRDQLAAALKPTESGASE